MGALVSLLARRLHIYRPALEYDLTKSPTVMGDDCPQLYEASLVGDWDAVRRHLTDEPRTAAYVDNSGNTSLHICCRRPHPPIDIIKSLIKAHRKALVRRTVDGLTPLHFAAYFSADGDVVDVMMKELSGVLERGSDNDDDDGNDDDDLEAAIAQREGITSARRYDNTYQTSSSSFLLRLMTLGMYKSRQLRNDSGGGGDASQTDGLLTSAAASLLSEPLLTPDRRRRTPLHCACAGPRSAGRPAVIRYMLLHSTDPSEVVLFRDERGRTAIDLVVDDYQEELDDALRDGVDATAVASSCLNDDGPLREFWSIITLLLVACTANSATTATEWLAKGASIYCDSGCIQAVHGACRSMGDDCPAQLATLARKIVQSDIDKKSIGRVSDLRARWENKSTDSDAVVSPAAEDIKHRELERHCVEF